MIYSYGLPCTPDFRSMRRFGAYRILKATPGARNTSNQSLQRRIS